MTPKQWMGLSTAHLVEMGQGHRLEQQTAKAFAEMQTAAGVDGVGLDIASSHRDFQRQLSIWNRKWQGDRPLFTRDGTPLENESLNDEQKLHGILIWSALPGASRHHWGTDLDVYDKARCAALQHRLELVPEEYLPGGPCHVLNEWLQDNMAKFGFYRPYAQDTGGVAPEPWHLSYQPVAKSIEAKLDLKMLAACLNEQVVAGKGVILAQLPALFQRYTLNQGDKKSTNHTEGAEI